MRINTVFSVMAVATGLLTASCNQRSAPRDVVSASAIESPAPEPPFRIVANDEGFEAPDVMAAGLRHVVFENRGSVIHEAMLVRLPPGKSAADYVTAVREGSLFPEGALDYSGPGLTSPGEMTEMWLPVDPGQYILICWNSGHATKTPVHPFIVADRRVDDAAPKEDVVLRLFDYRFDIQGTLKKGLQVIRVETPGPSMHEADIFRLHDGRTAADVARWYSGKGPSVPPAQALGGALDSHDIRRVVWLRRTFVPGHYVFRCAMPVTTAAAAHKDTIHADVGMVQELEITD